MPTEAPRAAAWQTIFAIASGAGQAGVAVVRISGPDAALAAHRLARRPPPPQQRASLCRLIDPADGEPIDQALLLWFPAPASFTGEDVLELQFHGGPAVLETLCDALAGLPGFRPAEAGEFSKRAFLNGRMDLTAAEGLADLIAAETRQQAKLALRQMDGELGRCYARWRETLLAALARLEAEIDFAPEEDLPDDLLAGVRQAVGELVAEIEAHLGDGQRGERLRQGLDVALLGPPNAGKSSLINLLAGRDVAIVTSAPGTTRDVLEVPLNLGGFPLTIADTAGLRETDAVIEAEGVRRARLRASGADLRVLLFDGATWPVIDRETAALIDDGALLLVSKADIAALRHPEIGGRPVSPCSAVTGEGVDLLIERLTTAAGSLMGMQGSMPLTRARHRSALEEARQALARATDGEATGEIALIAEDLRLASRALGRITGQATVEDLLDRIFGEFCIGK
jgi:tRNA modification GTPase